jgi:asparagine synthase (glutamine-hydrolysing)
MGIMCGICAVVNINGPEASESIKRMMASLVHRGPDANDLAMVNGCLLGHTRLSIIDLKTGRQPMSDPTRRYWITFNGELYNFREIRYDLEVLGYVFQTESDTEVILNAYAEWGSKCLDFFRGMFAFAIWDVEAQTLFAARDLFGEKPLYYAEAKDGRGFLVASEIKALLASGFVEPKLDLGTVDAYLAYGYVPPDRTIYQNIHTLPPGHYLSWQGGSIHITRYWGPNLTSCDISLDEAGEKLQKLLGSAVERQMVADVPVGAFLSGGLDSSSIVALMSQYSPYPIKTFSVGFGDLINELPYARVVADRYKTEHYEVDLGVPPVADMLEQMAGVYDEPFADSSHIPTYLISQFARKHVKVVLSGDGGDELFGGYGWYPLLARSEKLTASKLKWIVARVLSKLMRDRVRSLCQYSVAMGLTMRWPDMWTRAAMFNVAFRENERRNLWGNRVKNASGPWLGEFYQPKQDITGLNRGFYFDLKSYLPGDILVKVDRAAMAHGLETRAPFLDRDVVEFVLSLPSILKVKDDETKIILKQACQNLWPKELQSRNKQGFGAPYKQWLQFPGVQKLSQRIFSDGSALRQLLPGIAKKQKDIYNYQTWILLTLGLWLERHEVQV